MSGASIGEQLAVMSKAEKLTWLQFGLVSIASACMGWLWWSSWPDGESLKRNAEMFNRWPDWLLIASVLCVTQIKKLNPKEPMADERDRAINGEARSNGFVALALMVLLLATIVRLDGWQAHLTPEWISLALMSMLALALLFDAAYRIVRYRWS